MTSLKRVCQDIASFQTLNVPSLAHWSGIQNNPFLGNSLAEGERRHCHGTALLSLDHFV
jgi:hypothetical protein